MAKTAIIEAPGGPEQFRIVDMEVGDPGPGQIRIRHEACGLNFIDVYQRSGLYPLQMPHAMGMEAAGVIEAVGEGVTHLKVGDRAAYAAMPARRLHRSPRHECGAGLPAARRHLDRGRRGDDAQGHDHAVPVSPDDAHRQGRLRPVPCGGGGVGLMACQWAASEGIRLIGTAGTDDKCQLALDHGAEACINYRSEDWVARVKELTGGKGVRRGHGRRRQGHLRGFARFAAPLRHADLVRQRLGTRAAVQHRHAGCQGIAEDHAAHAVHPYRDHETCQQMARELFEKVQSGAVKIRIDQRFPLEDVAEAHRALEARKTTGQTILTL
jgi:NADPH2:quinone reductase